MGGGLLAGGRQLLHRVSTALARAVLRRLMAGGASGAAPARPRRRLKRRAASVRPCAPQPGTSASFINDQREGR